MKRVRKIVLLVLTILLVAVLVITAGGVWFVRRSWPTVSGTLAVAGLTAPVNITRDEWGVPHIYAANEPDLFFAQGYVHAQDRLWQMEFGRRVGSGTLSAFLGEATLGIDRYTRTIGLRRAAQRDWEQLDGSSRAILEQYAAGVTAYIETHRDRLPVEFTFLRYSPEPWTPLDTLTWGKLMSMSLAGDYGLDLVRTQALAKYGERIKDILPMPDASAALLNEVGHYAWLRDAPGIAHDSASLALQRPILHQGSNSWVIHGSRTATGKPLLADDTHLALNMPSLWYINHLHGGRFNTIGFTLPGVPLTIIGHNDRISWGATNLSYDIQDLYIEKLNDPTNPTQYEFKGQWRDLQIIDETIEVQNAEPVTLQVRLTHHGPIINDVEASIKDGEPMSIQWPDLQGSPLFKAIVDINLAQNWNEFRTALRNWGAPKQNFVYADIDGNIGYQAASNIPLRAQNHQGTLPVPGWTGEYEWQGFVPFEDMPSIYNPPEGYIIAANSRVIPNDQSKYLLDYFGVATYRAQQLAKALEANNQVTVQDVQAMQAMTYSLQAEVMLPYLLMITPANDLQRQALDLAKAWDHQYETDRVGASIFEVWYWFLQKNTIGDELGEDLTVEYQRYGLATAPKINALMANAQNSWFDDTTTPVVETRDEIIRRSLADALAWLTERYGSDPAGWPWGRLHTMTFIHQPLGQSGIPPLEWIFNSRSIPARGGDFTVNNAWFSVLDPFTMEGGTTQRIIIDLNNMTNTLAVQATGQNERLFHPHRDDMIEMWQNMQYHPLLFTQEALAAKQEATLTLTPQP